MTTWTPGPYPYDLPPTDYIDPPTVFLGPDSLDRLIDLRWNSTALHLHPITTLADTSTIDITGAPLHER